MQFIELHDVKKEYRMGEVTINAADGMTFSVNKGELAVIVGPSGSGKTTVLNMLGGMDTVSGGSITVDGKEISSFNRRQLMDYRRCEIGFVFQFYNLIPNLTAKENVELSRATVKDGYSADEMLSHVGLSDRALNFPSQLSGGEQQRVAIARALVKRPKLLLCDEPTGALDYETGKKILALLQDICKKDGMTVIIVTHNTAITPIADRVIHIRSSKVHKITENPTPKPVGEIEW